MPTLSQRTALCFAIFTAFFLTACSEPHEDEFEYQEEQAFDEESYQQEYNPADSGWRLGTLRVEFLLQQSSDFHEKKYDETSKALKAQTDIVWAYELKASASQDVWVAEDLSVYMPPGSDEERFEAMQSPPYFEQEDKAPLIDGALTYSLDYQNHTPNGIQHKHIDKKLSGKATVDLFELDNLVPSLYGSGYQFDLKIGFDYQQTGRTIYTATSDGKKSELDNNAEESITFNLDFYPSPEAKLNDYPYLYEYKDISDKSILEAYTKHEFESLARLQKIAAREVEMIFDEHVGAVTEKSKDKLVIEYSFTEDNKLLPFIANMESLAATPDSNLLSVRVSLSANK